MNKIQDYSRYPSANKGSDENNPYEELKRLRRENAQLKEARDILQRTVGEVRLDETTDGVLCPAEVSCSASFPKWLL